MTSPEFNLGVLLNAANNYSFDGPVGDESRRLLAEYKTNKNSWVYADQIISSPNCPTILKFTAIQSIQDVIKGQWNFITEENREGIRKYLMDYVISLGSNPNTEETILTQANLALVGLLLQEWPRNYTNFLEELIKSASKSECFCLNNINIIKMLCEQSLESNDELLTYARANELASALQAQAPVVYSFLENVISSTTNSLLILASFSTLKFFIKWINPQELLRTQVFQAMCTVFLPQPLYVTEILNLFSEIFSSPGIPTEFSTIIPEIFVSMMTSLAQILSSGYNFNDWLAPSTGDNNKTRFVKILPITLTIFLDKFGDILETPQNIQVIQLALRWLCDLTKVEDTDVLKTCCDFWLAIAQRCYRERSNTSPSALTEIYAPVLPVVRRCLIERMQKPEEIIITEDNLGEIVREQQRSTLTLMLHSTMKQCLGILTSIDQSDTLSAFHELIDLLQKSEQFSPDIYNSICWSVGAITLILEFEKEKNFLTELLRIQLQMCQNCSDPNARAIIASGIMYVCSKFPRFLQQFPKFLKTVISKLFEFMHQNVPGVKEMAVMSFKTIAEGCKRQLVNGNQGPPLILEIINDYPNIVCDLTNDLIVIIFDSLSLVISSGTKEVTRLEQFEPLMLPLNEKWQINMDQFNPSNIMIAESITFVLKCNAVIAWNMRNSFHDQFFTIFPQMMMIYAAYSQSIIEFIQANMIDGVKNTRNAKSAIIKVIQNFVLRSNTINSVGQEIIQPLVGTIFVEYAHSPFPARTPEVLNLLSTLFTKMKDAVAPYLTTILDAIFMPSVEMIKDNFDDNVPFRLPFYKLLKTLVEKYLSYLLAIPEGFDQLIKTTQWGYMHPYHEICETSLSTIEILINNIARETNQQIYNDFLSAYYLLIVHDMFQILVDTIHKFAFDKNVEILSKLLVIQTYHLNDQKITETIMDLFPNRHPDDLLYFVKISISISNDMSRFRQHIKDFLVTTRQFNAADPDLNRQEIKEISQANQDLYSSTMNYEGLEN